MGLRTNRALKFFAILLFSFEMIAPALISSANDEISENSETRLCANEGHFTNLLSSLLYEESSGEEEERESKDHKGNFTFSDFDFYELSAELTITETRQISWAKPHETTSSQPRLFTLFHTYLI